MNPLFVGIDIGSTHNVVQTMDTNGQLISRFKVDNDLTGTEALVQQVVEAAERVGAGGIRIGMEATNLYWWHLHQALVEHPALAPLQSRIAILNAKVIPGFKQIYPDLGKTDNLDARVIADCLRFGRTHPVARRSLQAFCQLAMSPASLRSDLVGLLSSSSLLRFTW